MLWFLFVPISLFVYNALIWKKKDSTKLIMNIPGLMISFAISLFIEQGFEGSLKTEYQYQYDKPIVAMFTGPSPYFEKCHAEWREYKYICFWYKNSDGALNLTWMSPDEAELSGGYYSQIYETDTKTPIMKIYRLQFVNPERMKWWVLYAIKDKWEVDLEVPKGTLKTLFN